MNINPLPPNYHNEVTHKLTHTVDWSDPDLKTIIRFRMISDPGFPLLDVSYCHGKLKTGELVEVNLPFSQLLKAKWKTQLVQEAKRAGVNAKQLGMFDNVSICT